MWHLFRGLVCFVRGAVVFWASQLSLLSLLYLNEATRQRCLSWAHYTFEFDVIDTQYASKTNISLWRILKSWIYSGHVFNALHSLVPGSFVFQGEVVPNELELFYHPTDTIYVCSCEIKHPEIQMNLSSTSKSDFLESKRCLFCHP